LLFGWNLKTTILDWIGYSYWRIFIFFQLARWWFHWSRLH
jgi:hypothetical protein